MLRQLKKNQLGVASIEVALVMPFIFIMMLGGAELARTVYQYNTLVKNVRDATKYVASNMRPVNYNVNGNTDPEVTNYKTVISNAMNLAVCGSIFTCSTASAPNLGVGNIKITYPDAVNGVTFVKVAVTNYSLPILFGFLDGPNGNDEILFSVIQFTMYQQQS